MFRRYILDYIYKLHYSAYVTTNSHQSSAEYYVLKKVQMLHFSITHCVKSVQIRSFFWPVFPHIRTEYGDLRSESPYSVQIRENTDQKKLRIWTLFMQCIDKDSAIFISCIIFTILHDQFF